jgi:hypothetical protein
MKTNIFKNKDDIANSRLIACAPDMLDVLMDIADDWTGCYLKNPEEEMDIKIKKIIEKATGQKIEDLYDCENRY